MRTCGSASTPPEMHPCCVCVCVSELLFQHVHSNNNNVTTTLLGYLQLTKVDSELSF